MAPGKLDIFLREVQLPQKWRKERCSEKQDFGVCPDKAAAEGLHTPARQTGLVGQRCRGSPQGAGEDREGSCTEHHVSMGGPGAGGETVIYHECNATFHLRQVVLQMACPPIATSDPPVSL